MYATDSIVTIHWMMIFNNDRKEQKVNKPLSLTVSKIFNGECDAMVDMTLSLNNL